MAKDRLGHDIVAGDMVTLKALVRHVLEDGSCLVKIGSHGSRIPQVVMESKDLEIENPVAEPLVVPV